MRFLNCEGVSGNIGGSYGIKPNWDKATPETKVVEDKNPYYNKEKEEEIVIQLPEVTEVKGAFIQKIYTKEEETVIRLPEITEVRGAYTQSIHKKDIAYALDSAFDERLDVLFEKINSGTATKAERQEFNDKTRELLDKHGEDICKKFFGIKQENGVIIKEKKEL
jgi:hypothetical protein